MLKTQAQMQLEYIRQVNDDNKKLVQKVKELTVLSRFLFICVVLLFIMLITI